jgi:hypothetical protein
MSAIQYTRFFLVKHVCVGLKRTRPCNLFTNQASFFFLEYVGFAAISKVLSSSAALRNPLRFLFGLSRLNLEALDAPLATAIAAAHSASGSAGQVTASRPRRVVWCTPKKKGLKLFAWPWLPNHAKAGLALGGVEESLQPTLLLPLHGCPASPPVSSTLCAGDRKTAEEARNPPAAF